MKKNNEKKILIVELNNVQNDTIDNICNKYKIKKSKLIRLWCDILTDLSGNIQIIAFDDDNIKILKNLTELIDTTVSKDIVSAGLDLTYFNKTGVRACNEIVSSTSFNGGNDDQENKEIL